MHFCFGSLVGIPIGITSSAVGLKFCVITIGTKKCKSIVKKKKKKHDKMLLLAKSKSNSIKALTCKASIDSNISHDDFFLINNVLKEFKGVCLKQNKRFQLRFSIRQLLIWSSKDN